MHLRRKKLDTRKEKRAYVTLFQPLFVLCGQEPEMAGCTEEMQMAFAHDTNSTKKDKSFDPNLEQLFALGVELV